MRALLLVWLAALTLTAQPKGQHFTLPNGLRVVHLEDHERPLVRARLHLLIAPEDAPPGRQGLASLVLHMVNHGEAAGLKADEFDRLVEDAGIQLNAALEPSGLEWQLLTRSRDQDRAFGLLADRLLRTVFDPAVLEAQKLACRREAAGTGVPPDLRLRRALILSRGSRPSEAGLSAITLADLLVFHGRVFRPGRAVLILHGDLGLEQAKRLVLLSLGSWSASEPALQFRSLSAASTAKLTQSDVVAGLGPGTTWGSTTGDVEGAKRPGGPPSFMSEPPLRIPAPGVALRLQAMADQPAEVPPEAAALLSLLVPEAPALARVQVTVAAGKLVATLDVDVVAGLGPGTTWGSTRGDVESAQHPGGPPSFISGAGAWSLLGERLEALRQRSFTQADLDRARVAWEAGRALIALNPDLSMDAAFAETEGRQVQAARLKALKPEDLSLALRRWLEPARLRTGAVGAPEALPLDLQAKP